MRIKTRITLGKSGVGKEDYCLISYAFDLQKASIQYYKKQYFDSIISCFEKLRCYSENVYVVKIFSLYLDAYSLIYQFFSNPITINSKWAELTAEALEDENEIFIRFFYAGGYAPVASGNSTFYIPIGSVNNSINAQLFDDLFSKVQRISSYFRYSKSSAPDCGRSIYLSSHSASILFHEIVGHFSEIDISQSNSIVHLLEGFDIHDIPCLKFGIDYSIDDMGIKGIPIDLRNKMLSQETGNSFLGAEEEKKAFCIRQRNLIIKASICINGCTLPEDSFCELAILHIQANAAHKVISAIVMTEGSRVMQVRFQIRDIVRVVPVAGSNPPIHWATVCKKLNSIQYLTLEAPACYIMLKRNWTEYIIREL